MTRKIMAILAASIFIIFSQAILSYAVDDNIRIAVTRGADSVIISVKTNYSMIDPKTNTLLLSGERTYVRVMPTDAGIKIGPQEFKVSVIKITASGDAGINVDGKPYRGSISILRDSGEKLIVVNELGLEDYLAGVLYEEVSHRWPIETLKAQAIVARTFAVYQASLSTSRDYDLTSDTYSQVYGGSGSERKRTDNAVAETKGMFLTYNGKIFPAYYHATCGGASENADNLWNIDLPVLKSVKCDWCRRSPYFNWRARITLDEIEKRLNAAGIKVDGLKDVSIASENNTGRVKDIKLTDKNGEQVIIAKTFRLAIGSKVLRSTKFKVSVDNFFKDVSFQGFGWGHGIGMCQWGAYFMARKGKKAEEILKFYYTGAEIKKTEMTDDKVQNSK